MSHQLLWESDNENLATTFTLSSDDYDYLLAISNLYTVSFTKKGKPINLYCYSRPNGCLGGAVGSWITSDNLTYNVYSCLYDFFLILPIVVMLLVLVDMWYGQHLYSG